ncbi:transposase [Sorangium sp. So ce362]|uniref:transposase n=1 Tax=Sorangium sp. So ce362 TaxID=3133303 RepID=UPI003F624923
MAPRALAVFSERARVRRAAVRCARWLHLARSDARRCAPCRGEGGAAALRAATPIAKERVEPQQDGLVRLSLKRAFADGTVAVDMDPLSLLCHLAASVPPPRFHTVKYAGVLASASRPRWRASASDRALRSQKSLRRRTMTPLRNASGAAIERSTNRAELFRPRTEPSRRSRSHPFGLLHYVSSRCWRSLQTAEFRTARALGESFVTPQGHRDRFGRGGGDELIGGGSGKVTASGRSRRPGQAQPPAWPRSRRRRMLGPAERMRARSSPLRALGRSRMDAVDALWCRTVHPARPTFRSVRDGLRSPGSVRKSGLRSALLPLSAVRPRRLVLRGRVQGPPASAGAA